MFVDAADQEKVIEIDADKVTDKKVMIVTLRTKQECSIFKNTYEEKLFNGQKPRISVLLCRDQPGIFVSLFIFLSTKASVDNQSQKKYYPYIDLE